MSVNSYLTDLANNAIIRDSEKQSISKSIDTLQKRLDAYFGYDIIEHFIFGSFTRGTILPRNYDPNSDIDYMVVFKDLNYQPQTYLNKLKQFVQCYYHQSDICQSHPTIILSLNHIKFELVPAIEDWSSEYKIPAKTSDFLNWIDSNPNDLNQSLTRANQENSSLIKPMIRLVKYWNVQQGNLFESYELEQLFTHKSYWHVGGLLTTGQLKDYVFDAFDSIELNWGSPQYKIDKLETAKRNLKEVEFYLRQNMEFKAEQKIRKIFPTMPSRLGLLGS